MLIRAPRAPVDRRRTAWVLTVLATAASTYALEAFAIAVGALLAASGVLAGLDRPLLLSFLAGTYVLWAAGLRVSLAANWSLLTRTGVSTNAPSKAAHDIARARKAGLRTRRWAASGAYVLTEAAKEVPYYAGAFGATLVSVTGVVVGMRSAIAALGKQLESQGCRLDKLSDTVHEMPLQLAVVKYAQGITDEDIARGGHGN